jgi:uncharacterized protein (TIGR02271 family)
MDPGEQTTGTRDEHYNLVSVLYHALHGAENCEIYALDAEAAGRDDIATFFREAQVVQAGLAEGANELLGIGGVAGEGPWHSVNSEFYHNNPNCQTGSSIEPENILRGTGNKRLCEECERLNRAGARAGRREPGQREDLRDEDELRVQRTEEELRASTREREAGEARVRKSVRTEREQVRVPKRREEVHVDRVPVEGREASEAEIGEDEVSVPVTEEEVVVEKRPEVKEEIRIRKDVVEEEELVEEDVRREEIDIEDQTERRTGEGQTAQTDQPQQQAEAQGAEAEGAEEEGLIDKAKKKLQGQ